MNKNIQEQIIADLKIDTTSNDDLQINDLSKFIKEQGVNVSLTLKTGNKTIPFPAELTDIYLFEDKEQANKLKQYIRKAKFSFLEDEVVKPLQSVINATRASLYNLASSNNGSYLTKDAYRKFLTTYEENKEAYDSYVEKLINSYPALYNNFKDSISIYVKEAIKKYEFNNTEDADKLQQSLINGILSKAPTEEQFKNKFEFSKKVTLFSTYDVDIFEDEDLNEALIESSDTLAVELIYSTITKIANILLEQAFKISQKDVLTDAKLESTSKQIERTKGFNFIDSPIVNNWIELLESAINTPNNPSQRNMYCEEAMVKIYSYYKNVDTVEDLDISAIKGLTIEYLEAISLVYV